jgi:hypothetical protein
VLAAQLRVSWSLLSLPGKLLLPTPGAVGGGRVAHDTSSPLAVQRRSRYNDELGRAAAAPTTLLEQCTTARRGGEGRSTR